jgi:hypothetical protein
MGANVYLVIKRLLRAFVKKSEILNYLPPGFGNRTVDIFEADEDTQTYTLSKTPQNNSLVDVYLNGALLVEIEDYTLTGASLLMLWTMRNTDRLIVKYW